MEEHIYLGLGQIFIVDDGNKGFSVPDYIPTSTFYQIKRGENPTPAPSSSISLKPIISLIVLVVSSVIFF